MKDLLKALIDAILANCTGASSKTIEFQQSEVDLMSEMWGYFAFVGIAMTLIYFILEMNRKFALEGGDLTIKSFFAPFLKLMIAIAVLSQGGKIIGAILSINNAMAKAAGGTPNADGVLEGGWFTYDSSAATDGNLKSIIDGYGLIQMVGIIMPLLLCFVVSLVLKLVWWYKGILYKLEVLFRLGIAPVSFADVYSGQNSNAIRYLKGFLALGIYGVALVTLPSIATHISLDNFVGSSTTFWEAFANFCQLALIAPFAALSCANAARTAAKEALGA